MLIRHQKIVRPIVTLVRRHLGRVADFPNHDLVRLQETRELDSDLFTTPRRAWDPCGFRNVRGHRDADRPQ